MLASDWIIWLIPAFPLLGFLVNVLLVRRERPAGLVAVAAVAASFVATLAALALLLGRPEESRRISSVLWEWISIGTFRVPLGLLFDPLTAVMALLVTGVGGLIHIYSLGYMHGDARPVRYFAYLNLFIFAMLMLVMADNLLLLFLGWEGVGLCSFLLIGHYFDRRSVPPGLVPSDAATKAFIVNRIGDAAFLLAIMAIFSRLGSLAFFPIESLGIPGYLEAGAQSEFTQIDLGAFGTMGVATAVVLLMLIGVAGKSAQFPLYTWLTDAMAGPTPVSALIHAATMVTAGVYLLVRNHDLVSASTTAQGWIVGVGLITAVLAALAAVPQFDIKRVLAYSTISQLGYMVAAVGMGGYVAAMFHLLTHGLFKALLFLGAGAVIHALHDLQDMRRMGALRERMPRTFWVYLVGALALAGVFPLAGFWSKDEILVHAWFSAQNVGAAIMLLLTAAITAFYMGRQVALIFFGRPRESGHVEQHAHDPGPAMQWPLWLLAIGALIGGVMNLPGLHWLNTFLEPTLREPEKVWEPAHLVMAVVSTAASAGGAYLGWWLYARRIAAGVRPGRDDPMQHYLGDIWRGAEMGWGLDWLYQRAVVRPYRELSLFLDEVFDREGIDGILVEGPPRLLGRASQALRAGQSGYFRSYALVFLVGVVLIVGYFALRS
ncbi:MAG TPA: NADH-quinone oxidoreductase subunit L [Roseiflexaceae bacterium]|nr:NADH-quinone oxidoreductase subunit L [Roseiflexaceae bacterium]